MVAPAEVPAITPPLSRTLLNSFWVSVCKYASASFHCLPPRNQIPVAFFNGATNSSVLAILGSRVCRKLICCTPNFCNASFSVDNPLLIDESSSAVVTIIIFALAAPPASSTNLVQISGPTFPPPTMISEPLSGPVVADCAFNCKQKIIARKNNVTNLFFILIFLLFVYEVIFLLLRCRGGL